MAPFLLGIIIPDRGDRPEFEEQYLRLIQRQTITNTRKIIITVMVQNAEPTSDKPDITWRYRTGYEKFNNLGYDLLCFWENDDWYAEDYLEVMVDEWEKAGKPDLFGTNYTIYYNLIIKKYFRMTHVQRASAMNTFIKPDLTVPWPDDHEAFTDVALWDRIPSRKVIEPPHLIAIGMKHGIGKCGGKSHVDRLYRYINDDGHNSFLAQHVDEWSLAFYNQLHEKLNENLPGLL